MTGLRSVVLCGCALWAGTFAGRAAAESASSIQNGLLKVTVDPAASGFSVQSLPSGRTFVTAGKLSGTGGTARKLDRADKTFGAGSALEISYPDGNRDELDLFPELPFALLRSTLHNQTPADVQVGSIQPFGLALDLGKGAAELRALSTAGLTPADKHPGGYEWIAVADPATRGGVVAGWLTHDRASGAMFCTAEGNQVAIQPQLDYGRLRIQTGQDAQTETLAIGFFDDARLGLEAWADAVAKVYQIHLPPKPVGYCTWYSDKHGGASDEKSLAQITAFAAKELEPFGFSLIQIDDGWQEGVKSNGPKKVFSAFNPKGPYPGGMKATSEDITRHGLTPGVWFMPFAGTFDDPFFKDHQDWFAKTEDGKPFVSSWGGTSLDMTKPAARLYLRREVAQLAQDWGYRYFKMDGLYTGTATKQVYVNSAYKPDGMGDAVLSDPNKTNIEAYRDGLKLVREAAGKDVFLLGCCAPQNMRSYGGAFGLLDAMRVGPDNGPQWKSLLRGPTFASRSYFLNGRIWWNDPDPIYVRASVPIEHARLIASWVTIAGDLTLCSDWLPSLPSERVELLRRTMPSHDLPARPVDLFENDPPRIWLLSNSHAAGQRDVIGLYNWTSEPLTIDEPVSKLGLDPNVRYVGFDFWDDTFVAPFQGSLKVTLPKESCKVLAIRPAADHPQVVSTSRHITQGIVDLSDEKWDPASGTLSGRSKVVANDPYTLRIAMPSDPSEIQTVKLPDGVDQRVSEAPDGTRVTILSSQSREVEWAIQFRK